MTILGTIPPARTTPTGRGTRLHLLLATLLAAVSLSVLSAPAQAAPTVTTVDVAAFASSGSLSPDGSRLYVATWSNVDVAVIDPATMTVLSRYPGEVNSRTGDVVVSPDGATLYVSSRENGRVLVMSAATGAITATITVGAVPSALKLSDDGSRLYVGNSSGATSVSVIDTATRTVVATVPTPGPAFQLELSPDGSQLYVPSLTGGVVRVISTVTNTVSATYSLPAGARPWGVAATPDGATLYVTSFDSTVSSVFALNTTTGVVGATIPVGTSPRHAVVSADGSRVFVANSGSSNASVVTTANNTVQTTVASGGTGPWGAIASGSSSMFFVVHFGDGVVSKIVLDSLAPATQTVTATAGEAITPTTAYTPDGFAGTPSYAVAPALPAGLSIDSATGVVSGTPTTAQDATTYTVTGTGSTAGSATATISIAVAATVTPASQSVAGTAGQPITPTQALTSTVAGAASYSVSPALPAGLSLNSSTGVVSGTPTTAQAATSHTITVTGATSGSATATVSVEVAAAITPTTQSVSGSAGEAITPTTALTPVGFPVAPTYTVSPALPDGLSLNSSTGVVSGTPTASQLAQTYTITGTGGGFSATTELVVAVSALSPATQTVTATQGEAITPTSELTGSGFEGDVTFTSTPLPAGLSLDPDTGVISGTPTGGAQEATSYTITGAGETSGVARASVSISVDPVVSGATTSVQGTIGEEITPTTAPSTDGFPGTVTYSIDPALPDGLSLDTATGVISGTPTTASAAADFTLTATDGEFTDSAIVTIQVAGLSPATQTVTATRGTPITSTAAITATGFTGAVTYVVDQPLPAGLTLDPATGVISGTPTGDPQEATTYPVTGSGATAGTASVTVSISVAAVAPGAPTDVVATPGANQAIISWTAPTDDGGDGPVTYTVTSEPGGATCTTSETSCLITGLQPGDTTFSVVATTPAGSSAAAVSPAVAIVGTVAPATVPAATTGLDVALTDATGAPVTTVRAGQQVVATATGFYPGSLVEIHVYSVPEPLGVAQADASGTAVLPLTFPSNAAVLPGEHSLVASGFTPSAATGHAVSALTVLADEVPPVPGAVTPPAGSAGTGDVSRGVLPDTGAPEVPSVWTALRLVLLGSLALVVAAGLRRREDLAR